MFWEHISSWQGKTKKKFYKVIDEPDKNDKQTNANECQGYFRAFVACATDYIWAYIEIGKWQNQAGRDTIDP